MVSAKIIALVVSIVMPGDQPDVTHMERQPSFDECWAAAKAFTERDLSDTLRKQGALGLKATCGYYEMPSRDE